VRDFGGSRLNFDELRPRLRSPQVEVWQGAVEHLARAAREQPEAFRVWRELAQAQSCELRVRALHALAIWWPLEPASVEETLHELLDVAASGQDPVWLAELVEVSRELLPLAGQEAVVKRLRAGGELSRAACLPLLWRIAIVANHGLDEWLTDPSPVVRARLAWELAAYVPAPLALGGLLQLAHDREPEVVLAVRLALDQIQSGLTFEQQKCLDLNGDYRRLCQQLRSLRPPTGQPDRGLSPAWLDWKPPDLSWTSVEALGRWSNEELLLASECTLDATWALMLKALHVLTRGDDGQNDLLAALGVLSREISSPLLREMLDVCHGYEELLGCPDRDAVAEWRVRWRGLSGSPELAGPWSLARGEDRQCLPWWEVRWWNLAKKHICEIVGAEGTSSARTEALP